MMLAARVLLAAAVIAALTALTMAALSGYHGNWPAAVWYGGLGLLGLLPTAVLAIHHSQILAQGTRTPGHARNVPGRTTATSHPRGDQQPSSPTT